MKVVSNASPLISLARIGMLDGLRKLYPVVYIPMEVFHEVVVMGAGLPGASAVSAAQWISVASVRVPLFQTELGAGESAAIRLAIELEAELLLMDERKGRKLAASSGLAVTGCIGILEELHRRGEIADLRAIYENLLRQGIRVDIRTLQHSLKHFGLLPL